MNMNLNEILNTAYGRSISECSNAEIYAALLKETDAMASKKCHASGKKKLYYISAEFLIGKLLSNNLINLGVYEDVRKQLAENGKEICEMPIKIHRRSRCMRPRCQMDLQQLLRMCRLMDISDACMETRRIILLLV